MAFEKTGRAILMKKAAPRVGDHKEMADAVQALAQDMKKVGRHVEAAERSLDANLSRHIGS